MKKILCVLVLLVVMLCFSINAFCVYVAGTPLQLSVDNSDLDRLYFTTSTNYRYFYVIYDVVTYDSDFHVGTLNSVYLTNDNYDMTNAIYPVSSNGTLIGHNNYDFGETNYIIEDTILEGCYNAGWAQLWTSIDWISLGYKYVVKFDTGATTVAPSSYNLKLYTLDYDSAETTRFDVVFDNLNFIWAYDNSPVSTQFIDDYRTICYIPPTTINFLYSKANINGDIIEFLGYQDSNGLYWSDVYDCIANTRNNVVKLVYRTYAIEQEATTPTYQTITPTIETHPPVATLPSDNLGNIDDNEKSTFLSIIDHVSNNFMNIIYNLTSNCIVLGVPILTIIGALLTIIVVIILIKVALK